MMEETRELIFAPNIHTDVPLEIGGVDGLFEDRTVDGRSFQNRRQHGQ